MELRENIARIKELAQIFLKNDDKIYLKDIDGNLYFCNIVLIGEDIIRVHCFGPKQREGNKYDLYWPLVVKLEKLKEDQNA